MNDPRPGGHPGVPARAGLALAAGVLALAYLWPLRRYGLNVEDEGLLVSQIVRVVRGEVPYLDFSTGYTPGFFLLAAWLWRRAGDVVTFRAILDLVHVLTVAGLATLVARVARPLLAIAIPLAYLIFIPVVPGEFCGFNVPYPAWFATLGWIATAAAMLAFLGRRRRSWLVLAGIAGAATLSVKPNSGLLAIAAATAVLLMRDDDEGRAGVASAALWLLLWAGILGGTLLLLGPYFRPRDVLVFFVPVLGVLSALPSRARILRRGLAGDVAALFVPAALATLPWLIAVLHRLGTPMFLREVLFVGGGGERAERIYYLPYPPFETWALLLTGVVLGFAVLGVLVRRGTLDVRAALAAAVIALVAAAMVVAARGVMPERLTWSLIWQLESAGYPLALATALAGCVWLWRDRRRAGTEAAACLAFAVFMHVQLYPRADFMHLIAAVPLAAVVAAFLLERVIHAWERGCARTAARWPALLLRGGIAVALLGVIVVRMLPTVAPLAQPRWFFLPFGIAAVGVEEARAQDLRDLTAATTRLGTLVPPGGASLGFPALEVMLLLNGSRNPTPYGYFWPGLPDHRREAEAVDALAAAPPGALASLNRHFTFFDRAPAYYFLLRRFVRARYVLAGRDGRFDVLGRSAAGLAGNGTVAARPDARAAAAETAPAARETALREGADAEREIATFLQDATADRAEVRRTALDALLGILERRPAAGLELYVDRYGLDRRRQILLLRTIRDSRDARAASYLFAVTRTMDPRLGREALQAMAVTRAEIVARQHLWAGAEVQQVWPGRESLVAAVRTTVASDGAPVDAAAFAAHLAGLLQDTASIPALRRRLAGALPPDSRRPGSDAAAVASSAASLVVLAPEGLACELTPLLARDDPELVALLPATILALLERGGAVHAEARACLAAAIDAPGAGRAAAIWIAAASGEPSFAPGLRNALGAPADEVRRAAAWALGESVRDAATAATLAAAVEREPDDVTRELLRSAGAKQAGARPRALAADLYGSAALGT